MNIGIDYYDTITRYPDKFKQLTVDLMRTGNKLHIISAVKRENEDKLLKALRKLSIQCDSIEPLIFLNQHEVPQLKLEKCIELSIDMMFDDRQDVCELLNKHGILACHVVGGSYEAML